MSQKVSGGRPVAWEDAGRQVAPVLGSYSAIVVISSDPLAAAYVALGIARAEAEHRRSVVGDLVGDLPPLRSLVREEDPHGITDSFLYGVSLNKIGYDVEGAPNLYVMPSGTDPLIDAEIIGSQRWTKLASGFAPVAALLQQNVNVALGTDGAASNNRLDMFQEMRTAALLAKAVAQDAQALPAHAALRAATLAGARALGIQDRTGSIVPGKAADLVALDLRAPELAPCFDPVSQLVYAAGREHVSHVWVDGRLQVSGGKLVNKAFSRLDTRWELWQNALKSHADS